jgi:hypothetical protein
MKPRGGTGLHGREGYWGGTWEARPAYTYMAGSPIQALTDIKANQKDSLEQAIQVSTSWPTFMPVICSPQRPAAPPGQDDGGTTRAPTAPLRPTPRVLRTGVLPPE